MEAIAIGWVAGILDGEGSILMTYQEKRKSEYQHRRPEVSVASCDIEMLERLRELLGGSLSTKRCYREHHSLSWAWRLKGAGTSLRSCVWFTHT